MAKPKPNDLVVLWGEPMTIQAAAQTALGVQDALRIALRTSYVL
jgi:hypothetical protein